MKVPSPRPELLIKVADDGAGADQPLIDEVFESPGTAQDDEPHVRLNMARAIVEQHGGQLEVHSEPGQGTYVRIRMPSPGKFKPLPHLRRPARSLVETNYLSAHHYRSRSPARLSRVRTSVAGRRWGMMACASRSRDGV